MDAYTISSKGLQDSTGTHLSGKILLPASKSISNRLLIIRALAGSDLLIANLSQAEDTLLLQNLLSEIGNGQQHTLHCGNAGTVMRFLTAFLAIQPGTWLLSGSERMHQRPIGILVEALKSLGASIDYTGTPGYPPLKITGKKLGGGKVVVDASVSSQFVSALLMIAPLLHGGLTIQVTGNQVSVPYVEMTVRIMESCGIVVKRSEGSLIVEPGPYVSEFHGGNSFTVEADWSSAAFWYEAVALADSAEIILPGLFRNSLQGDAILPELYRPLGVETVFEESGVRLTRGQLEVGNPKPKPERNGVRRSQTRNSLYTSTRDPRPCTFDLSSSPDLAPPLIVTCAALGIPARFTGLHHLRIKESDRIEALVKELNRLRISVRHLAPDIIETEEDQSLKAFSSEELAVTIHTYGDHRIAMAFALLAIRSGKISISDSAVVSKSYPGFWDEMRRIGFRVSET